MNMQFGQGLVGKARWPPRGISRGVSIGHWRSYFEDGSVMWLASWNWLSPRHSAGVRARDFGFSRYGLSFLTAWGLGTKESQAEVLSSFMVEARKSCSITTVKLLVTSREFTEARGRN